MGRLETKGKQVMYDSPNEKVQKPKAEEPDLIWEKVKNPNDVDDEPDKQRSPHPK